jgi:putative transcriptional regulator
MKQKLLEKICIFLLKSGYTVKSLSRNCFDVLSRKNSDILLIKVLEDANSISKEYAEEMIKISSYLSAYALIIAERASLKLEDNVVYSRFNVNTLNFNTFRNCLENKLPFIKSTKAGLVASIDGKKLRNKREELGYSLNTLSKKVGVSKKMIQKYENETSEVTINNSIKIYDIFGHFVFNKINVFNIQKDIVSDNKSDFTKKYNELGFEATETKRVPFDIIAKKEKELILTEIGDKISHHTISLSKLLDADNLVIFKRKKPKDIPAVTKQEFLEFEKANELIKFLREF